MPDYITREEFDMYVQHAKEEFGRVHNKLDDVNGKQDKTLANMADHKAMHSSEHQQRENMRKDLEYIKSDKIWLNRIVIGFCVVTALAGVFKLMFGV